MIENYIKVSEGDGRCSYSFNCSKVGYNKLIYDKFESYLYLYSTKYPKDKSLIVSAQVAHNESNIKEAEEIVKWLTSTIQKVYNKYSFTKFVIVSREHYDDGLKVSVTIEKGASASIVKESVLPEISPIKKSKHRSYKKTGKYSKKETVQVKLTEKPAPKSDKNTIPLKLVDKPVSQFIEKPKTEETKEVPYYIQRYTLSEHNENNPGPDFISHTESIRNLKISRKTYFKYIKELGIKTFRGGFNNIEKYISKDDYQKIRDKYRAGRHKESQDRRANELKEFLSAGEDNLYTVEEAALHLSICEESFRSLIRKGYFKPIKHNKRVFVNKDEVWRYKKLRFTKGGIKKKRAYYLDNLNNEDLITYKEASKILNISEFTLLQQIKKNCVKPQYLKNSNRDKGITKEDLEKIRSKLKPQYVRLRLEESKADWGVPSNYISIATAAQRYEVTYHYMYSLVRNKDNHIPHQKYNGFLFCDGDRIDELCNRIR